MNIHEAARYLGLTEKALYHHIDRDGVPYGRCGRSYRFDPDELDAWVHSRGNTRDDLRLVARR